MYAESVKSILKFCNGGAAGCRFNFIDYTTTNFVSFYNNKIYNKLQYESTKVKYPKVLYAIH